MARVTIEDCIDSISNRFQLVMCSAQRGRELASGVEPTVERDRLIKHEKNAVIALREITQGNLDVQALEDAIVRNHRRFSPIEAAAEEEEGGQIAASGEGSVATVAEISPEILPDVVVENEEGGELVASGEKIVATTLEVSSEISPEILSVEPVQAMPVQAMPVQDEPVEAMPADVVSDEENSDEENSDEENSDKAGG